MDRFEYQIQHYYKHYNRWEPYQTIGEMDEFDAWGRLEEARVYETTYRAGRFGGLRLTRRPVVEWEPVPEDQ